MHHRVEASRLRQRGSARGVALLALSATALTAGVLFRPILDAGQASSAAVDFDTHIRPVLAGTCLRCHGGVRELGDLHLGDLHLGEASRALAPAKSGRRAIVPGDPKASELLRRIADGGPDRMPPDGEPLTPAQVEAFRRWIRAGAPVTPLWSHRPIDSGTLVGEEPAESPSSWPRRELDRLVLAGLRRAGLAPAPDAERSTLLRRASLDIIGLPPTVAELDAFLGDSAPDAYERMIDRLLASPHFGERWARPWLDLARYADTQGYEKDERRTIWAYRDWVITALNADMPYDRFLTLQMAGDLLPDASDDDRLATAFHRNTLTNTEGGTDDEEFRMAAVFDRVTVTTNALMGITLQCAQCHGHPYDAYSQEEYYRFVAFFNQTEDADRGDETPILTLRSPGYRERSEETTTVPVLRELPADRQRITHFLDRGSLRSPKHAVTPGTPAVLPPMPEGAPANRLGLAAWMTAPEHPLTDRVAVNRVWETLFGRGIVETVEDFGTQGSRPDDAALLDHLVLRFRAEGRSLKALIREIATSATYRQSAIASDAARRVDPDNRLWSRAPRYRLEAEAVRDSALAVSGLLSRRLYGPSVMPPQPAGIWAVVYSGDQWTESVGEDRYRRAIYTFWRRSSPYPSLIAFDAPSREVCSPRRGRSNSPLAALVTMNDPAFVEAARALATTALAAAEGDDSPTIAGRLLRMALLRDPLAAETERLVALVAEEEARFIADPESANRLVGAADPRLAAWTVVASVILNLDEFLSRG
jgi:hypothetical protein